MRQKEIPQNPDDQLQQRIQTYLNGTRVDDPYPTFSKNKDVHSRYPSEIPLSEDEVHMHGMKYAPRLEAIRRNLVEHHRRRRERVKKPNPHYQVDSVRVTQVVREREQADLVCFVPLLTTEGEVNVRLTILRGAAGGDKGRGLYNVRELSGVDTDMMVEVTGIHLDDPTREAVERYQAYDNGFVPTTRFFIDRPPPGSESSGRIVKYAWLPPGVGVERYTIVPEVSPFSRRFVFSAPLRTDFNVLDHGITAYEQALGIQK